MATRVAVQRSARSDATVPNAVVVLAGLATTAALIHISAAAQHLAESWVLGVFFVLVGAGQLLVGCWIYRHPRDTRARAVGATASIIVALLWIFSRTTGLPFGPDRGAVTSVGVADTIATVQELTFAAIALPLTGPAERSDRRIRRLSAVLGPRLISAVVSASLFMAAIGGHQH